MCPAYFRGEKPENPPFTVDDLNAIYPYASALSKTDEAFKERAQDITYKLQKHEKGYYEIWEDLCTVSIEDIRKDYEALNVEYDLWYGESTCDGYVDGMIDELTRKGLTAESDGALIMDVGFGRRTISRFRRFCCVKAPARKSTPAPIWRPSFSV